MSGTRFSIEVQPILPKRLSRLNELANDLFYSWERQVRGLLMRLDAKLWTASGHNPKVFLRRISQQRLNEAVQDRIFIQDFNRLMSTYDTYIAEKLDADLQSYISQDDDLIAYFCAEYGFYESLPIYSGGLGILAGDHCKAASDMGLPFIGIGMLYRQGYFNQTIDSHGRQVAHYTPTNFNDLPVSPALDVEGREIHVSVDMPGRTVRIKVWKAKAGRISLYLLDTDLPENSDHDRAITYQLYGGDINTRMQQEIVLGIGGVRALNALGLKPTAWHINEGHSAFQILERARRHMEQGHTFASALEIVASGTVFTTHTPVPAGHDIFEQALINEYFRDYIKDLDLTPEEFIRLGSTHQNPSKFNMTILALKGSRAHNGVSRIHGEVASRMERDLWPDIPPEENPIRHVTNGVHLPTFLAKEWSALFDMTFGGGWRNELRNHDFWERIEEIPDHTYWSLRQTLKSNLLDDVRKRITLQATRNEVSQAQVERISRHLRPEESDILILGFARRFATYKRATLLLRDPDRLERLLNNTKRPVLLLFAGKAHPNDVPGQQFIKSIHDLSQQPRFLGKIILLEGYDLALSRKLVSGVDVWINTPEYPMEASGTSGQKAGMNGVINLSILDGWWGEGYNGANGWAISPHSGDFEPTQRDALEAQELMDILEFQAIPSYYDRNGHGYSDSWVKRSKASMKSIIPDFNSQRMVQDYLRDFYSPAIRHHKRILENDCEPAKVLSHWKSIVRAKWPEVKMLRLERPSTVLQSGASLKLQVSARLADLRPQDVVVECLVGVETEGSDFKCIETLPFVYAETNGDGTSLFELSFTPKLPGLQHYKVRIYPYHHLLAHRFEMGLMQWL